MRLCGKCFGDDDDSEESDGSSSDDGSDGGSDGDDDGTVTIGSIPKHLYIVSREEVGSKNRIIT